MDRDHKPAFRLLPDGSMEFPTLEAMLEARQKLSATSSSAQAQGAVPHESAPVPVPAAGRKMPAKKQAKKASRAQGVRATKQSVRPPLPNEGELLAPEQSAALDWIAEQGEAVSTRDIAEHFSWDRERANRLMQDVRARLADAGYSVPKLLKWWVTGFGADKRSFYQAEAALRDGAAPASH